MNRLPTIKSVKSSVSFAHTELQKLVERKTTHRWFWKKRCNKTTVSVEGYESISTCSVNVPVRGFIEIAYASPKPGKMYVLYLPAKTSFFVTCINRQNGIYFPAIEVSLS